MKRSRFQGTKQIVYFNRRQYAAALGAITLAAVGRRSTSHVLRNATSIVGATAAYFSISSVVASWWVYDRSPLYRWRWLVDALPSAPRTWANVHVGFDEAGPELGQLLGPATAVVDISPGLTSRTHSIELAQRLGLSKGAAAGSPNDVPVDTHALDAALLIFSAHEVRDRETRVALMSELKRITKPDGLVVIVEHIRDVWNAAVFGPGAMHFYSRRSWLSDAEIAGLTLNDEIRSTPYVRALVFRSTSIATHSVGADGEEG